MRSYAVNRFQMLGMHEQSREFILIIVQSEQNADARFLQFAVILHGGGGNIDIHTADRAVLVLDSPPRMPQ